MFMSEEKEKIISILSEILDIEKDIIVEEEDLTKTGLDSIGFVKLIVALEIEFGIEYPDDMLDIANISSVDKLLSLIDEIKKSEEI